MYKTVKVSENVVKFSIYFASNVSQTALHSLISASQIPNEKRKLWQKFVQHQVDNLI